MRFDKARAEDIAMVMVAAAFFAALDTTTKWVAGTVPLFIALSVRYLIQAGGATLALVSSGGATAGGSRTTVAMAFGSRRLPGNTAHRQAGGGQFLVGSRLAPGPGRRQHRLSTAHQNRIVIVIVIVIVNQLRLASEQL